VPRLPGRPSPSAKRPIRAVVRFPDSAEIRHFDEVPSRGTRLRSASGSEWFVAEALPSGRATYTVFCVGRDELAGVGTGPVRFVEDVAQDLLQRVHRLVRDQHRRETDTAFVASFVSADGVVFEEIIHATSLVRAESEALERARGWNVTMKDVQPGPEWLNASYAMAGSGQRSRRFGRFLPRVR
jgi:hypothetical protein